MKTKLLAFMMMMLSTSCSSCGGSTEPINTGTDEGTTADKQVMRTMSYAANEEEFANPERGFFTQMDCNLTDPVSETRLKEFRSNKKSLVQFVYYLDNNNDKPLSEEALAKINLDMEHVRRAGLKVIPRFAYTKVQTGEDAPMAIIENHLNQLKPILSANKDVIACVQAGFIGAWGEWYYSTNNLNNTASYNQLINKWLEVLPADRCVQVRTPKYKQDYLQSTAAITESQAFQGTPISRIAHHNDAFMADETNMGTYQNITADKTYLGVEGLYLPIGGETCLPTPTTTPSSGQSALQDLQSLHWSFLNDAYDTKVLKKWEQDGVMTTIKNKLGYRIQLIKGEYSTKHIAGSDLYVKLTLQNVGFAPMYNPRDLELVLCAENGSKTYVAKLPEDPRTWKPSKSAVIEEKVALPKDIAPGKYKLYFNLPDASESLAANPLYAVRLANQNMWDSSKGYNDLGIVVEVSSSYQLDLSSSSVKFIAK